jgi:dsDNA-binding SOS-regulon protein
MIGAYVKELRREGAAQIMFAKSRKDKFVDQAQDLAHDLTEAIAPHVERARDELSPRLADARDQVAPLLADARDQMTPHVENARDTFVNDFVPYVQQAVNDARDQAGPVAEEARRRGVLAAAALKGEPVRRTGRKRKFLLFAGLIGLGAFAVQKMRGGESANWQTSYTPPAAPPAPPAPPSPSAPMAGSHAADISADSVANGGGDSVGATPGESLSDATEEPHPVTTPDAPAEGVDVGAAEAKAKAPKKKS